MSTINAARQTGLGLILAVLMLGSTTLAQQYGQNPASRGFVPLANGPVPEGTTGDIGSDTDASGNAFGNAFGFDNRFGLNFGPSRLSFTATDITDSGLLGFLGSFGNLDLTFESMSGVLIHLEAVLNGTTLTVNVDFNGGFGDDSNGDGSADPDNSNPNAVPDANPADDNSNTDTPDDFDTSPGNPFAN